MSATDTMFSTALEHAREADFVLPLIEAQKNVALTIRHYNRLARDDGE